MKKRQTAKGKGTTEFGTGVERQLALLGAGCKGMQHYLDRHPPVALPDDAVTLDLERSAESNEVANRRATKILDW